MQIILNLPDDLTQLDQATLTQEIALALFQQQHITFNQAAQLAGISHSEFQQLLTSRNIDVSKTIADDPDDDPEELILESIRVSLQQIREGKTRPISELWDGIDV
jgi:predicted HTH domain antitoxin